MIPPKCRERAAGVRRSARVGGAIADLREIIKRRAKAVRRWLTKRSGALENKKVFGAQAEAYYPGYYYNKAGNYLV